MSAVPTARGCQVRMQDRVANDAPRRNAVHRGKAGAGRARGQDLTIALVSAQREVPRSPKNCGELARGTFPTPGGALQRTD